MTFLNSLFEKSKIRTESKEEIEKNRIVVFLIPNKIYQEELLQIAKSATNVFGKIIYLSLNRPSESIIGALKEIDVNTEKFLFVDAVNKGVKPDIAYHNVVFINSPQDFEKFNIELNQIIEKEKFECLLFDSLSTLLIYHDDTTTVKFIHDLIMKLRLLHDSAEFTCLLDDVNSTLVKDLSMFADEIVNLGGEKAKLKEGEFRQERIAKLESESRAIEQAYASKLISEQSYLKTEERINQ